nr:hypothetical protein [uncultured Campylobacter sp.]
MEVNQKVFTACQKNINRLAHQIARELYKKQEAKKYDIDFLGYKQVAQEDLEILIKNFIKKHKEAWEEVIKNSEYI